MSGMTSRIGLGGQATNTTARSLLGFGGQATNTTARSRLGLGSAAPSATKATAVPTAQNASAPSYTIDETYFIPGQGRSYTFNPLEKNPNLVYLSSSIDYNQYLKDVQEYRNAAEQAASSAGKIQGALGTIGFGTNTWAKQADALLAGLRQKYPNIGKPSEEDILRATPNVVAQVQQPAPALVRSKASGSGALNTIGARRRGGRGGLATIQGQATGLNPISS